MTCFLDLYFPGLLKFVETLLNVFIPVILVQSATVYMCHKDRWSDESGANGGHGHGDIEYDDADGDGVISEVVVMMVVMVELEAMVSWLR